MSFSTSSTRIRDGRIACGPFRPKYSACFEIMASRAQNRGDYLGSVSPRQDVDHGAVRMGGRWRNFPIDAQREIWAGIMTPSPAPSLHRPGRAVPPRAASVDAGPVVRPAAAIWRSGPSSGVASRRPTTSRRMKWALFSAADRRLSRSSTIGSCGGLAALAANDIVVSQRICPGASGLCCSPMRAPSRTPGAKYIVNPLYRMPLLIPRASMLASTAVRRRQSALDSYLEMNPGAADARRSRRRSLQWPICTRSNCAYADLAAVESAELNPA